MSITIAVTCGVILILLAGLVWIRRRGRRPNPFTTRSGTMANPPKMATVASADMLVYVNEDGSVRELTAAEQTYVTTEFSPLDGARPYIKSCYADRTAWGIQGFLPRAQVPQDLPIHPAPQNTLRLQTPQAVADSLAQLVRRHGGN